MTAHWPGIRFVGRIDQDRIRAERNMPGPESPQARRERLTALKARFTKPSPPKLADHEPREI